MEALRMETKKIYTGLLQTGKQNNMLLAGLLVLAAGFAVLKILRYDNMSAPPCIFSEILICAAGVALGASVTAIHDKLADACLVIFGAALLVRGIGVQPDTVFQGVYSTGLGSLLMEPACLAVQAAAILFFIFTAWRCAAAFGAAKRSAGIYMLVGLALSLVEIAATFKAVPMPYIALSCGTYFHLGGVFLAGKVLKVSSRENQCRI